MRHRFVTTVIAALIAVNTCVAELPKAGMQIIDIAQEEERTAVVLEQGETLLLLLPNGSGGFIRNVKIDTGKAPIKYTRMLNVDFRAENGQRPVGGGQMAVFFEALKPGTGELVIKTPREPNNGPTEVRLKITVERPTGADAPGSN